ncbi:AzlD family protein [Halegenticoccus soli]|uniref:AzlD family protein n=1 Tax=Halegenticoccus soli TaxID=1985678 RepID=UPI000C6E1796|nr:AzlD domain-containing protein [Halegenticoccus soli]
MSDLDSNVVLVILGMSVATYVTKAGGFWVLGRVDISSRIQSGIERLPGAIVVAVVLPSLTSVGPPAWIAAVVVIVGAWRTDSVVLTLMLGIGCIVILRQVF